MKNKVLGSIDVCLWQASLLILALVLVLPASSWAHGIAGKRFFPTTFQVEDPFVSDEFSLLLNHIKEPEGKVTAFELEYAKRITPLLGVTVGESLRQQDGSAFGFGNLELGAKYQLLTNEEHEAILSLGTNIEFGGTGASRVGADSFSTISPALFFGKGLGDLPEVVKYLRPLAVTGVIGTNFPTKKSHETLNEFTGQPVNERNPTTFTWAFSVQYSLMYLNSYVKDVGLGAPFNRMILVTEFPMETCLRGACKNQITGTANPGVVWAGKYVELGVAAQIPINARTGKDVGVLGLFHLFIDDLFPNSIGGAIFK